MPVATTMPIPRPPTTMVPLYVMFFRSPRDKAPSDKMESVYFSTATDSPVSAASSTCNCAASTRRISAGTTLPASSSTISPGTKSAASICIVSAPLTTVAEGAAIFFKAAIAFSALCSWIKPITAFNTTTVKITMASLGEPAKPAMAAATSSTMIKKSLNWPRNIIKEVLFIFSFSSFVP